jgi:Lantibiotic biosynthesis dehydratase C-term
MTERPEPAWVSFHLHYHEDQDRLLLGLVEPLVESLLAGSLVDRFFFVRYPLGGPHIRLRLRCRPGSAEPVAAAVVEQSEQFLRAHPSRRHLEEEVIRKHTQSLLAQDPQEDDDAVYPDNFVRTAPCRFEVERYGGEALLEPSLDFFAVSSARSLELLRGCASDPSRRLHAGLHLILRYGLGFARSFEEHIALLRRFPVISQNKVPPAVLSKAGQIYGQQKAGFLSLMQRELEAPHGDVQRARSLAREVRSADEKTRRRIFASHLHMTANRLGLSNLEETYISTILCQAADDLLAAGAVHDSFPVKR